MEVIKEKEKVLIKFNKNILNEKEIIKLIEYLQTKEILYKSKLTSKEVETLDNEMKKNWWEKNKDKILKKIDDSNR